MCKDLAAQTAGSDHKEWRISHSLVLSMALPNMLFTRLGLLVQAGDDQHNRTAVYGPICTVVWE
ncbi:hypothetical protein CE195_01190 [Sodalis-like symbiont of Philaenus spumarius]|nr:hypothetical protein CE195_01190 [Sodalis-like symbiont of Philaenus spumarius]